jgi:hypothetical protein
VRIDVTGQDESKVFYGHRVVIASASDYMAKCFHQKMGMLESSKGSVTLVDLHADVVEQVLEFVYTGRCEVQQPHLALMLCKQPLGCR